MDDQLLAMHLLISYMHNPEKFRQRLIDALRKIPAADTTVLRCLLKELLWCPASPPTH